MPPSILLIYPPVSKPSEPPAGIAKLNGILHKHDINCTVVDANLEGILYLLKHHPPVQDTWDTWSKRAAKSIDNHLESLRSLKLYKNSSRYQRAISDINRMLDLCGKQFDIKLTLGNYQDLHHEAVNSTDLLWAAQNPSKNIFYSYFSVRLSELIEQQQPLHIGISLNYLSQALTAFAMIGFIKSKYPHLKIVLGGGLITSWVNSPKWQLFRNPQDLSDFKGPFSKIIDHIITGQAESKLLRYLGYDGQISLAPPRYQDFELHNYLSPGTVLPYAASSGCYWNRCGFCPEQAEGNCYNAVADSQLIEELTQLCNTTKPALVHLLDNAISPSHLTALAQQYTAKIPWYGFARISKQLCDLDFCRQLKKSGCAMLKLGVESGDQAVLNAMVKGVTIEMTATVLETLHQAGIATYVYLLFGTPTETEQQARHTLKFVQKHAHCITFLNLAIFNLPLASSVSEALVKHDFYSGDLSLYSDFDHPLGWNRKQVRKFLEHTFKRDPAIAAIIRRDPPLFTSNHAPFMQL